MSRSTARLLWLWVPAFSITACSGGATPAGSPISALPRAVIQAVAEDHARVHISIEIPKKHGRRPAYVSPATQSLKLLVTRSGKTVLNKTVNLTATSQGCSSALASTFCSIDFLLPPGKGYVASITTYDGVDATGNALSTGQGIAFDVTTGVLNTVKLTLSGIPANIILMSAGTNSIYALAQDAGGNFIFGAGAPSFTAANASGPAVATIAQPTTTAPNKISFSQPAPPVTGTETISVTASYPKGETNGCAATGAVCTATTPVTATYGQELLVANYGAGNVLGYLLPATGSSQPANHTFILGGAYVMAQTPTGTVYVVGYQASGAIAEIAPPYTALNVINTGGPIDDVSGVAVDPGGDIFASSYYPTPGVVLAFAAPGTGTPVSITNGIDYAYGLAADASANLYAANYSAKTITVYAPPYTGTPVSVGTASIPNWCTIAGNTLYVAESAAIEIFTLPLSNSSTPTVTLTKGVSSAQQIVLDGKGNLWETNQNGGTSSDGSIQEFTAPFSTGNTPAVAISESKGGANTYGPYGLGFDASGNLYVVNEAGGANIGGINVYSPPFTPSSTASLALAGAAFSQPYFMQITPATLAISI